MSAGRGIKGGGQNRAHVVVGREKAAGRVRGRGGEGNRDGRALTARESPDGKVLRICIAFIYVLPLYALPWLEYILSRVNVLNLEVEATRVMWRRGIQCAPTCWKRKQGET